MGQQCGQALACYEAAAQRQVFADALGESSCDWTMVRVKAAGGTLLLDMDGARDGSWRWCGGADAPDGARRAAVDALGLVASASRRVAEHRLLHAGLPLPRLLVPGMWYGASRIPSQYLLAASRLGLAPADVRCSRMRQRASPAPCRRVARWCRWGEQGGMTTGSGLAAGLARDRIEVAPGRAPSSSACPLPAEAWMMTTRGTPFRRRKIARCWGSLLGRIAFHPVAAIVLGQIERLIGARAARPD